VDTTYDIEGGKGAKLHLGKGPAICIKDKFFGDPNLIKSLLTAAKSKNILHQMEIWEEAGSDLIGINSSLAFTKSCFVGFPIKNPSGSIQTGSLKDMENMEKMLKTLFEKI
jgi:putative aminopeptidase FrvX